MKTILVPLTLSSDSFPALAIAGNLARQRNAKLVLLHAVQLNIAGEERGIQRARLLDELGRDAEARLRELAGGLDGQAAAEILVCEGRPADAIVETARRLRADAIVMRMHGRRRWFHWLHRHTALQVARQAPCRTWLVAPGKNAGQFNLTVVDPRVAGTNAGMLRSDRPDADHSRGAGAKVLAGAS
jgi:nucleotide-binding universal stress UspA family protein